MDAWQTHQWRQPIRLVSIRGNWKEEYFCTRCRRRFVDVNRSGEFFAAYAGVVDYEPLAPEISAQWLREPCPGRELKADSAAYSCRPRVADARQIVGTTK